MVFQVIFFECKIMVDVRIEMLFVGDVTVKVTIVTSSSRLIEFLGPKASQKCLAWLKSKKVDVLFNDS